MAKKLNKKKMGSGILTAVFSLLSLIWVSPILIVLMNSFKKSGGISLSPFEFPNAETFNQFNNYINGITHGNYPFYMSMLYSLIITVLSVAFTSHASSSETFKTRPAPSFKNFFWTKKNGK